MEEEEEEVTAEEEATEEDPAVAGGKTPGLLSVFSLCFRPGFLFFLVFVTPLLSCILIEQHIFSTALCKRETIDEQ